MHNAKPLSHHFNCHIGRCRPLGGPILSLVNTGRYPGHSQLLLQGSSKQSPEKNTRHLAADTEQHRQMLHLTDRYPCWHPA
jgi:hypothetical protein